MRPELHQHDGERVRFNARARRIYPRSRQDVGTIVREHSNKQFWYVRWREGQKVPDQVDKRLVEVVS